MILILVVLVVVLFGSKASRCNQKNTRSASLAAGDR